MELNFKFWQKKASVTNQTVSASSDILKQWLSLNSSKTGINVNHETALQASVSLACARVIAEGLAQIPLKVFKSREDGGSDATKDHPLYKVLHDSPNDYQTAYEWREMVGLHLTFAGNAYSLITRGARGQILELLPLNPADVKVESDPATFKTVYKIRRNGSDVMIANEDILHLKGVSWDGFSGLDGVKLAREAIGLSLATEEHGSKMFSNGATIPGVLTTEQSLTKDQLETLRSSFQSAQQSLDNAWKIMITHGGLKYQSVASANDSAQFLETRMFQVEEVCRHFRVMPIMVGYSDKAATYASAEQMFLAHVVHTMGPWYARLEQSFNKHLLSEDDYQNGYYTKFIVSGLLRGSHKDRAEFYTKLFNVGALNPNEIRAMEEMNPYDDGNDYRVPMNTETPGVQAEVEENGA